MKELFINKNKYLRIIVAVRTDNLEPVSTNHSMLPL